MKIILAIPAHNEEATISGAVTKFNEVLARLPNHQIKLVVADNCSTDRTASIVKELEQADQATYFFVSTRGKGAAIRAVWEAFPAEAYAFSDADIAVHPNFLEDMVASLENDFDVAYASRTHTDSVVARHWLRRFVSKSYNLFLKLFFKTKINDAPCGFKIIKHHVIVHVLPQVTDSSWFFDTELILRAERLGYKIEEIPVDWREGRIAHRDSKVNIFKVSTAYVKKVISLWREFAHLDRSQIVQK